MYSAVVEGQTIRLVLTRSLAVTPHNGGLP